MEKHILHESYYIDETFSQFRVNYMKITSVIVNNNIMNYLPANMFPLTNKELNYTFDTVNKRNVKSLKLSERVKKNTALRIMKI